MTPEEIAAIQKENKALKAALDTKSAALEAKTAESEEKDSIVKTLESKLEKSVASSKLPTVKIDKALYQVMYPSINHNGKIYTAEDVITNTKVCKELIEMESGMLELVVSK